MSLNPRDELSLLKVLFARRWPEAHQAILNPKSNFHNGASVLWLGFKEGYMLGKNNPIQAFKTPSREEILKGKGEDRRATSGRDTGGQDEE